MKIILVRYHDKGDINTRLPESLNRVRGIMPPLGIAYIAAVLESEGYEVKILDVIALNLTAEEFHQIIVHESPEIVGITSMISNVKGALEAARISKDCGAVTVLGGPLMSLYPQEMLSYDFIDFGITGEAEFSMLELVRAIENKSPLYPIKGLVYKESSKIVENPACIIDDLDTLPFPARHLLPIQKYSSLISLHPAATMIASRGCPYRCGFCIKGPSDVRYRMRNPASVVDEMQLLVDRYRIKEIMFYDDTITLKRDFIVAICNEILKRNFKIKWESPTRLDRIDIELLKLMHKAGCIRLRYGVESGDLGILKLMNKGINLEQTRNVFKWTREIGLETFAYFVIGYIRETPQAIMNTIALAKELRPDLVMFTVATPYPQTPLFELSKTDGLVDADYWREFVLGRRNDRLPYLVQDADIWARKAYRSFYFRGSYIRDRLWKIRSWHDIEKYLQAARGILSFKMSSTDE